MIFGPSICARDSALPAKIRIEAPVEAQPRRQCADFPSLFAAVDRDQHEVLSLRPREKIPLLIPREIDLVAAAQGVALSPERSQSRVHSYMACCPESQFFRIIPEILHYRPGLFHFSQFKHGLVGICL